MNQSSKQYTVDDGVQMIGPLLVVLSDVDDAAVTPSLNQFGGAVAAFLEMYGFGMHAAVTPANARVALTSKKWAAAIILHQSDWSMIESLTDLFERHTGAYFLEGPISTELAAKIGLSVAPVRGNQLFEAVTPPGRLSEHLQTCFDGYIRGEAISLEPIISSVGRIEVDASGKKTVREEAITSAFHNSISNCQNIVGFDEVFLTLPSVNASILGRKGKSVVAGAPLFNLVCQRLGVPSMPAPWRRATGERNGENLDLLLLLSLGQTAAAHGCPLVSIEPWPDGVAHPITLRHDVDRPVASADWERLLNWQDQAGIRPTWYYLSSTVDKGRIAETVARGHEIALHYTNLQKKGAAEHDVLLQAVISTGSHVVGASCHGGNYHGARDLMWLEQAGFQYAEVLTRCAFFPFRAVSADNDNAWASGSNIWAVARHLSVDKKMSPPEADFGYGLRTRAARTRFGAHAVIMNHPDINFEATVAAVESYQGAGVECWTQAEVIEWWRETHMTGAIHIRYTCGSDGFRLSTSQQQRRAPVLRVWADVIAPNGAKKSNAFGPVHTLFPADREAHFLLRDTV